MKSSRRFTLIELLVVVAIIGILAAMLLPVLGRAKYRARLITCVSNLKQVCMSAEMYANENESFYPYRRSVDNEAFSTPYSVRYNNDPLQDDVEVLRELGLEEIMCPFTSPKWSNNGAIWSNQSYYFGWFTPDPNLQLKKQGQDMAFNGNSIDVLATDTLHHRGSGQKTFSSHPDYGTGILEIQQTKYWKNLDGRGRGPVDLSFGRQDGSVYTLMRLRMEDDRLVKIPYENSDWAITQALTNQDYLLVPKE